MNNKFNDLNYYQVSGWMINRLGLSGNELLVFALVYGFCQKSESHFYGSANYIAAGISATRRTVMTCLKSLCEKEILIREDYQVSGVECQKYFLGDLSKYTENIDGLKNPLGGEKTSQDSTGKFHRGCEKISQGGVKKFHRGCEKISHYNNSNNKEDNKGRVKKEDAPQNLRPPENSFSDYLNQNENQFSRKPNIPKRQTVLEFFLRAGGDRKMAQAFIEQNDATGWYFKGSPIIKFEPLANKFINSWHQIAEKNKPKNPPGYGQIYKDI